MTQLDSTEFKTQTALLYADNTNGDISAADLRTQMDNLADSASFKTTNQVSAPTVTDDGANSSGRGSFTSGDIWIDIANNRAYICINNTTGAASWIDITQVSGSSLTDAQIKTAYENNVDTNAFTDAEQTKLASIEANSTADQTGAEIEALIDAELGNTDWKTGGSSSGFMSIESESSDNYVSVTSDAGKYKRMTSTLPTNFVINTGVFSPEDEMIVEQANIGTVTITPGPGMTINSRGGLTDIGGQFGFVSLKFISSNEVILGGDIQ